jgi:hypothetical protein
MDKRAAYCNGWDNGQAGLQHASARAGYREDRFPSGAKMPYRRASMKGA